MRRTVYHTDLQDDIAKGDLNIFYFILSSWRYKVYTAGAYITRELRGSQYIHVSRVYG